MFSVSNHKSKKNMVIVKAWNPAPVLHLWWSIPGLADEIKSVLSPISVSFAGQLMYRQKASGEPKRGGGDQSICVYLEF